MSQLLYRTCTLPGPHTNPLSSSAEAPKIIVAPEDTKVMVKGEAVFVCKVSGNPAPTIKWLQNDRVLRAEGPHLIFQMSHGSVLKFTKIKKKNDRSRITCLAENPLGSVRREAVLTVYDDKSSKSGQKAVGGLWGFSAAREL